MNHENTTSALDPNPAPRDLAAVIDAMLAEIPEGNLYSNINYWQNVIKIGNVAPGIDPAVGIAGSLVKYAALGEPWYERVMAIWSGEAEVNAGEKMIAAVNRDMWGENSPEAHGASPTGERDAEGWRASMGAEFDAAEAAGKPAGERPRVIATESEDTLKFLDSVGSGWVRDEIENSPTGDAPNLAGEAWASDATADLSCSDCHEEPEIILIAQKAAKCVRCFLLAGMNSRCFACEKNPTEAIVRAIHPTDGKDDTVGTCIDCLLKHVSAGRN